MDNIKQQINDDSSHSASKCTVLLVDDQPIIAEGIRRMLADADDIIFHYCEDPSNAIQMATEVEATVVLQDLVMPDIDGMTLVRFFRANPQTSNIPIIVLSSKEDPQVKSDAFSNGANDYLVKLPDQIELLARVRAHSKSYIHELERDAAFQALREMQIQLEESNKKLQELSSLDGLTGIANRRQFDESLDKEWRRAARNKVPLSLILIDIDFFKPFNDNYGHQAGDDCLILVAKALKEAIVRPTDVIARYGGEEFTAILPDTDTEGAIIVAEKLRTAVESLKIVHEHSTAADHVTISLGIATNADLPDLESLIHKSDERLYEAKESGRNRYISVDKN